MCILMTFGPGAMPVQAHLENGCASNPDGFGWAILQGSGEILTGHTMDADRAMSEFVEAREATPEGPALFHARITTHGRTAEDNCHPFRVAGRDDRPGDMVLAHNGILPTVAQPLKGDLRSDTRILAEEIMMRNFRRLDRRRTRRRLEDWLGTGNKIAVLTSDPFYQRNLYVFNAWLGEWIEGGDAKDPQAEGAIWYSNGSYAYNRYATWEWPTTVGQSTGYKSSDRFSGYTLVCRACRYAMVDCWCEEYDGTIYLPTDDAMFRGTNRAYLKCAVCYAVGMIDSSATCTWCNARRCCEMVAESCQCWGSDDPDLETLLEIERELEEEEAGKSRAVRLIELADAFKNLKDVPLPALPAGPSADADVS